MTGRTHTFINAFSLVLALLIFPSPAWVQEQTPQQPLSVPENAAGEQPASKQGELVVPEQSAEERQPTSRSGFPGRANKRRRGKIHHQAGRHALGHFNFLSPGPIPLAPHLEGQSLHNQSRSYLSGEQAHHTQSCAHRTGLEAPEEQAAEEEVPGRLPLRPCP